MADDPKLVVAISAKLDQFEKQLKEAGLIAEREVSSIEKKLGGTKDLMGGLVGGAVGGLVSQLPELLAKARDGFEALQNVIVKLFPAAFPQFEQLNTLIKTHGEIVAGLKDSYGEAAKGIREFSRESVAVLETRQSIAVLELEVNLQRLTRTVIDMSVRALPSLAEMEQGIFSLETATVEVVGKFKPFEAALKTLFEGFNAGTPDIRAFREAVAAIARENQSSVQIQLLAKELLALTADASTAQRALDAIAGSMRQVGLEAQAAAAQGTAFRAAMDKLGRVAPTPVSSRQAAKNEHEAALLAAQGTEERRAAMVAYEAALKRVTAEEARRAPAAPSEKDALTRAHDQLLKNLEVRDAELDTIRLSVGQQEEARQLALLTAAAVRAKLDPEVAVTAEMREQARLAGIRRELIVTTRANLQELVNSSKEFGSALADAFKGMVLEGKKLDEVIKNLANRLASRSIEKVFDMLFAPQAGGGLTTPFLQLFQGRMAGGPVSGGSPYLVGERGPELFVPGRSGMIVPNSATRGGAGAVTFAPVNNIDARGSSMGESQFKAILAANNRQMLQAVAQSAPARQRRLAMLGT